MARWRKKGDPTRVTNWLGTLRYEDGDRLRLVRVHGVGSVGVEVISVWRGRQLTEHLGVESFALSILDLAQGHCDEMGQRTEYRMELLNDGSETPCVAFTLRCEPAEGDADTYDDEDPTPAGQIRQQMSFTRSVLANSQRAPMAAMEMMAKQLDMSQQRIIELERERAAMLDTYAEALTMIAQVQSMQQPQPSMVEQATQLVGVAPGFLSLFKTIKGMVQPVENAVQAAAQTGIVKL